MKKVVSFFLSFLIFLSITVLIFVFSVNLLSRENVISKLSHNINYLELVNIKAEEGDLKRNYDEFYVSLEEELSNDLVIKIYESELPSKLTTTLLLNEFKYLFQSFSTKVIEEESIHNLIYNEIKKMGLSEENREHVFSVIQKNSYRIVNIEKVIRERFESLSKESLLFIRYLVGYPFKIILLCILTISIILEFLINKRNYLPFIFVPTILSSLLSIFVSLFLVSFIKGQLHEFLFLFLRFFISYYSDSLLVLGLSVLFISILSLMFYEIIICHDRMILKPKIKLRHK